MSGYVIIFHIPNFASKLLTFKSSSGMTSTRLQQKFPRGYTSHLWHGTLGFLAEISFTLLLYHPGGCLGCPEKRTSSRNYNLFVWSSVFQPKLNDIKKPPKKLSKSSEKLLFFGILSEFVQFGLKNSGPNQLD